MLALQQMALSLRTMCPSRIPALPSEKSQGHNSLLHASPHTKNTTLGPNAAVKCEHHNTLYREKYTHKWFWPQSLMCVCELWEAAINRVISQHWGAACQTELVVAGNSCGWALWRDIQYVPLQPPPLTSASATDAQNSSQSPTCYWAWVSAAQTPETHQWDPTIGHSSEAPPSSPFTLYGDTNRLFYRLAIHKMRYLSQDKSLRLKVMFLSLHNSLR